MHKDILLVVCALLTIAAVVVAVNSFERKNKLYKTLQEERYSRMVAEESLQKNAAKVATLENELKISEGKMAKIKQILDQEKTVNSDLKSQYERLAKIKADLEAKLKSTLQEQPAAVPQTGGATSAPANAAAAVGATQ